LKSFEGIPGNFRGKHPQFRDGKINSVIKKDEIANILGALATQGQIIDEIEHKKEYL